MILYTLLRDFIRKHPQRTTGLLLTVFGSLQTSLAMFQSHIPPLAFAVITMVFGVIVTVLGFIKSQEPPETTE